MCMACGIDVVICSGEDATNIQRAVTGEAVGTRFLKEREQIHARQQWLRCAAKRSDVVHVDVGAKEAILSGRSLLAKGVERVEGNFERGDVVTICANGTPIAVGVVHYSVKEATRIAGCHSSEIERVLGYRQEAVIIHRDNMVLE